MPLPKGSSRAALSEEWEQAFRLLKYIRLDMQAQTKHLDVEIMNQTRESADSIRQGLQEVQTFMEALPEIMAAKTSYAVEALLQHRAEQPRDLRQVASSKDPPLKVADCQRPDNPKNVQVPGGLPKLLVPGQIRDADLDSEDGEKVCGPSDEEDEVHEMPTGVTGQGTGKNAERQAFSRQQTKTLRSKYLDEKVTEAAEQEGGGKHRLKRMVTWIKNAQSDKAVPVESLIAPRRLARTIVVHARFEAVVSVIMLLCGLQIGVEADHVMTTGEQDNRYFEAIGLSFNIVFTIELILRLSSDGAYYFSLHAPNIGWNLLDFVLVFISWLTQLMEFVASLEKKSEKGDSGGMSVELLRMLRLLRIIKVMRIIRVVRFFSELRIMINGILGSSKSLLWALLLLMLIIFLFGVTLMQVITSLKGDRSLLDENLATCFGSLGSTMLSLYKAISGGVDWNDCAAPLHDIHPVLELIFCSYVFLTLFCVLNIITGIFVDNAKALKQMDEDAMFQESLAARKRWVSDIAALFSTFAQQNKEAEFTFEDFKSKMQEIRVQTLFRNLGINLDVTSPEELWELFDIDDSGSIDADEFSYGVKLFNGPARSIDLYKSRKDIKQMSKKVEALFYTVMDGIETTRRLSMKLGVLD